MNNYSNLKPVGKSITLAIPTRGNEVDDHFGHCEYYTLASISAGKKLVGTEVLESPIGCGCKSDIATTLKNKNVTLMLAGNIGQGAIDKISAAGIQVIRGCSGPVEKLINDYLNGKIKDNGQTCAQHEHGQECSHN